MKTRPDIDAPQIGLLGISQAGWVRPLAATYAKNPVFLISISAPASPRRRALSIRRGRNAHGTLPDGASRAIVALLKLE